MKVYLFDDYLKTIHGEPLTDDQVICEIEDLDSIPNGLHELNGKLVSFCMIDVNKSRACIKYVGKLPKSEEACFTNEITCPHCGTEESDSWEADDSDDEHCCSVCDSIFSYERQVEVTYTSKIVERNEHVEKLKPANGQEKGE